MKLILLLGIPYLRKHKLRTALTVAGIVLGVALFLGMHSGNRTVLAAFRQTVNRVAGSAELQVMAGETGFPEEILEKVQAHPDVRVAVPVIEASVSTGKAGQGNLLILAVDMTGDQSLRDYDLRGEDEDAVEDPLVFLAQPDSIIVSRQFADRNGLKTGDRLSLGTMEGEKQFVVRGVMRAGGLASAYGGNLAVMDVYAAQLVFGRGRSFDRIDLAVREGATVARVQADLERLLGPGFQVETPESRGKYLESVSAALTFSVNLTSAVSLLIGVFIIYNAFSIAVTQRQSEIGVLRALGATRRQVMLLFLGESVALGAIGSALGIVSGRLLARGVAGFMSAMVEQMYTVNQVVESVVDDPWLIAWTFALGLAASVLGGVLPARRAARVDPVLALQKGRQQVLTAGENRARRMTAVLALAAAIAMLAAGGKAAFLASYLLLIAAALLMTPSAAMWLTRALRPLWKRARPVEGSLAADSLAQAPRRTSATVAALMLSLALAVSFAGIALSSSESLFAWMRATMNFDLIVTTSENISSRSFRFPPEVAEAVAAVEGVDEAQPVRFGRTTVRGRPVMLVAADIARISRRVRPNVIEGSYEEMVREGAAGRGVLISDNFSLIEGLHLGDAIEIPSPEGVLRLPVAGVTVDYTDQRGSILIDRGVYLRHWKDETINVVRVYLKPGVSAHEARQRILDRVGARRSLFVMTSGELRDYVGKVADQWFGMTYLQLFVAVLIAMLGIINSLTVSIIDRRRELGVLQAVGGLRRQVRHAVWMEAVLVGVIGVVLGIALGAAMLYYNFVLVKMDVVGIRLEYVFPTAISLLLFPVILGAAFVASLWPAEAAVRASLVEALEYE
jgi:putative ABC transport system permease protein